MNQLINSNNFTKKLDADKIKELYSNREYSVEEIAKKLHVSFWSLYYFMNKNDISRRSPLEANYVANKNKPRFQAKQYLSIAEEKLRIAGIMLYWAEGTLKGNSVDFANSSAEMIKIFLRFLREICGVNETRLRVYLYGYSYQNIRSLKSYWHKITRINLTQFTKPYIRNNNPSLKQRKLPYGLIHIRYNDKRLLELIRDWIDKYIKWAGTQVAKGGRLSKSSVLPKGRMEK